MDVIPRLLTEQQASQYLNIPEQTLRTWRYRGKGPPFVRVNRADPATGRIPRANLVRYPRDRLDAWIEAQIEEAA
jgi:hypothetical protein